MTSCGVPLPMRWACGMAAKHCCITGQTSRDRCPHRNPFIERDLGNNWPPGAPRRGALLLADSGLRGPRVVSIRCFYSPSPASVREWQPRAANNG